MAEYEEGYSYLRGSDEPYSEPDIDHKIQAEIDECIAYADALRVEEGPTREDEDPAAGDEGLATRVEGPNTDDLSHGLDDESRVVSASLGLGYGSLRRQELPLEEDHVYSTFETPPLPEWTSSSLPISPSPSIVPSPVLSPMIPLMVPSPVVMQATAKTKGFLTELGAQVEMQGGLIHDHARYQFRSLEYEQERVAVTFGAIWRPVLALESWAGQTDAQRAAPWHAISDMQGENRDLQLQLVEERRARLELVEVVDSMRRGQDPRGDV
ncbi:hypothetical protein Tco_1504892 [Tanacetum coccineum]